MVDYFLKFDGVAGDSHDSHHVNEIEVLSFSWGETNSGSSSSGTGAGAGRVQIEDFHFTTITGSASPKLMLLCANGKHAQSAVLVARRPGRSAQEYLKITLSDVTVSAYHIGGSGEGPVDQVSLRFNRVQMDLKPQKATGALGAAIHGGWDVRQSKEI